MTVTVAQTAGFCFGVQRAVDMVEKLLDEGVRVATLGAIVHNPQVLEDFRARGVVIAERVEDIPAGFQAVIRAHGVPPQVIRQLEERGVPYADATCTDVKKIQGRAAAESRGGRVVLIAGDATHPEVLGIAGNCTGEWHCFADCAGFAELAENGVVIPQKEYVLLAQTTFDTAEWKKCREFAKNMYTNIIIFDTICRATVLRQQEADALSQKSDVMLVIGGRNSSNTAKLARICEKNCRTILVENPLELHGAYFEGGESVGITAGASTPAFIIKEVRKTMSDFLNEQEEMSFEEMLEQSFKPINNREKVTAIVTNVSANEIGVDLGTKHAGYVPLSEYTDDPSAKLTDLVKVGDELELLVLRVNDVEGTALLSKKRLDAIAGFEKIMGAVDTQEILEGVVTDVVKGGVIALTNGVRVFIPASQAMTNRGEELTVLLRQPVKFKILEVNRNRRRAVGSIRIVQREERKLLEDKFWETAAVGNTYQGSVKSLTSYGAFVDLGGVDGMIHISELSWSRIKHPSEVVSVGDAVEVYVRDIDAESRKISLGYKKTEDNPWEVLRAGYQTGDTVTAQIVSMTPFGAFARVIPGVDGLIHISQISTDRVNNPADVLQIGQEVDVRITDIDFDKKRVSLSIRALMAQAEEAAAGQEDGGVVYEAAPQEQEAPAEAVEEAADEE